MAKGRKEKYDNLSDKEKEGFQKDGMDRPDADVNVSALDTGRKEFSRRNKEAKKEKRRAKKTPPTSTPTNNPAVTAVDKAVTKEVETKDPNAVETVSHTTIGSPGVYNPDADPVKPSYSTEPKSNIIGDVVDGQTIGEVVQKNVENKKWSDIIDGDRGPENRYDVDIDNASKVNEEVQKDIEEVNAAKAVADVIANPDSIDEDDNQATNTMTAADVSELNNQAVNEAVNGDADTQQMGRDFRDYLNNSKINASEPAIEKMGLQQYYPDLGTPLQVGSYSGSLIGNVSIFGHGSGRIPMGIIDARKRAMDKAATQRAKNKNAIIEMAFAKGAVPLQGRIDDGSWEIINKYQELSGGNMGELDYNTKLGREFFRDIREHQTFATRTKSTEKMVNKLSKDILNEKVYVSESTKKAMAEFNSGMFNIENLKKDPQTMAKIERRLKGYQNATFTLSKHKNLKMDELPMNANIDWNSKETATKLEEALQVAKHGNYDNIYSISKHFFNMDRVHALVDQDIEQNGLYTGEGGADEREKRTEEYYNYVLSLHAEQLKSKISTVLHNSRNKNKALDFKKQKYKDSKTTLLTSIVDDDFNRNNEQAKADMKMKSELSANGSTEPSDVKTEYRKIHGFESVNDPNNLNKLGGIVPLSEKQKKNEQTRPAAGLNYEIDGKILSYVQAQTAAKYVLEKTYSGDQKSFEKDRPELAGMLTLPADGNIKLRIEGAEHGYGMDGENGERIELGTDNYGANADKSYNMYTERYSSSYETNDNILSDDGLTPTEMYVAGGIEYGTYTEAEAKIDEINDGKPFTAEKAKITTITAKEKVTHRTPKVSIRYNIDNKQENSLAGASLADVTRDLNIADVGGSGVSSGDGVITTPDASVGSEVTDIFTTE